MASIHRRPNSKFWHAAWRGAQGRLILRSTKQTERNKALAFALECERAERLAKAGSLTEVQARKIVADIMERTDTGETLRNPSASAWFREWLESKQSSAAATTVEKYRKAVDGFLRHLGKRADKPLSSITPRDIESFLNMRTKNGLSPTSVTLDGKILRASLNKARRQGVLTTNPAEAVDLPGFACVERGTFSPAEVKMLVNAADGEWKTLILLAYFTGSRLSDCCRMEWADIDLKEETLSYTQSKTGRKLTIPIHPELLTHLEDLAGSDKPEIFIMPHMANLKSGGRHGLSEGFKRIMRKAGLDLQTVQGGGVRKISRRTFHALRHSFTSALANEGVAPEVRMKLTGHRTEAVHRGYTHHEMTTLKKAIAKLPGLGS